MAVRSWLAGKSAIHELPPGRICLSLALVSHAVEFEVLDELPSPKTSPGNPEPVSGLPTVRLGQFPEITDTDAIDRLRGLFG